MCPRGEPDIMDRHLGHMNDAVFRKIVDEWEYFTEPCWFHLFGEPLMHPQLFEHIKKLSTANPHAEYYLTDMAKVLGQARRRVVVWKTENSAEVLGANTRAELSFIDYQMRMSKCHDLMAEGVTIFYPATCVIDSNVEIAADTVID